MIYVTGDTHGEQSRFYEINLHGESNWTDKDVLIICGDFGFIMHDGYIESLFLDKLEHKPYTICFIDGNHENFPAIFKYPEETWCGGKIHRIRKNVLHLMRGQVFEIQGKRIFTMGGAYSIDRAFRSLGYSYWNEELPSKEEYDEAVKNLKKAENSVDYIISHTAPKEIIRLMKAVPDMHDIELTGFLEWIMYEVKFTKWYFGHWHKDEEVTDKFRAVYFDVLQI